MDKKALIEKLQTTEPAYLRCDCYLIRADVYRIGPKQLSWYLNILGLSSIETARIFAKRTDAAGPAMRFCRVKKSHNGTFITVPMWRDLGAMLDHLEKHNDRVELIDQAEYQSACEQMQAANCFTTEGEA